MAASRCELLSDSCFIVWTGLNLADHFLQLLQLFIRHRTDLTAQLLHALGCPLALRFIHAGLNVMLELFIEHLACSMLSSPFSTR